MVSDLLPFGPHLPTDCRDLMKTTWRSILLPFLAIGLCCCFLAACDDGPSAAEEDLTIDGRVEGKIMLTGHQLTIEENGHVTAEIHDASTVIVRGTMIGNITADDKVEVASQGSMRGDIRAPRIVLADGSRFKGRIDTQAKPVARGTAVAPAPTKAVVEVNRRP